METYGFWKQRKDALPVSPGDAVMKPVFVAGHRGLAGGAILREMQAAGYDRLITRARAELDLTMREPVREFFEEEQPEWVVLAAAKVGGIKANNDHPVDFLLQN